jgi:hypothetical protein
MLIQALIYAMWFRELTMGTDNLEMLRVVMTTKILPSNRNVKGKKFKGTHCELSK